MAVRGVLGLSLLLLVAACGNQGGPPADGTQNADAPKRRIALQDLVEQNKISYATAVRCMYLADAAKDATGVDDRYDRYDRIKYHAKFYALQLIPDNPGRIDADVGSQLLQETIVTSVQGSDEQRQLAANQRNIELGKELDAICVPLFLEQH